MYSIYFSTKRLLRDFKKANPDLTKDSLTSTKNSIYGCWIRYDSLKYPDAKENYKKYKTSILWKRNFKV